MATDAAGTVTPQPRSSTAGSTGGSSRERPVGLGYHEPLDGLRGLALLAIIVFHSGVDLAPGAFLSVSTFFTLSGFLITALLLAEHGRDGGISMKGFWERRLRRLLPAALVVISAIAVVSVILADTTQWLRLRADALASVFYVANWRFILAGDSYGASFESPSPYTHFWSLAIEEQFYLLLPLVVVGVLVATRSRRALGWTLAAALGVSLLWANFLVSSGASVDRLYFGTDVRLPELIVGALLALWWMRRRDPLGARGGEWVSLGGAAALAAMVVLWMTADLDDRWFYRGGLTLYSCLTVLVVVAAMTPGSAVARVVGWRPLVWVGVLSYAGYLVHYPILLWLRQNTDLGDWLGLAVALPLTFGLAVLSGRFIERPIRERRWIDSSRVFVVALVAMLATAALVVALTGLLNRDATPGDVTDLDQDRVWQQYLDATAAQDASDAPRINIYGDSTALVTGAGLSEASRQDPESFVARGGWADLGCGLITGTDRRVRGEVVGYSGECTDWLEQWSSASAADPADVAVVGLGPWEVVDQPVEPGGEFTDVAASSELAAVMSERLSAGVEALLEHNGMVVILNPPDVVYGRNDGRDPSEPFPESDPARMAAFREVIAGVAAEHDRVEVLDLAAWVDSLPDEAKMRPDGVHFSDSAAIEAGEWLGPELVELHRLRTGSGATQVGS